MTHIYGRAVEYETVQCPERAEEAFDDLVKRLQIHGFDTVCQSADARFVCEPGTGEVWIEVVVKGLQ